MKKLMRKMRERKGFTLAELLIVVAIIAVLVAISIPIFTAQLEKSRDSVSVANMRAGYAEIMTCVLAGADGQTKVTFTPASAGAKTAGTYTISVAIKSQQNNNWSGLASELPWIDGTTITTPPTDPGDNTNHNLTITVDNTGAITAVTLP